MLEATKLSAEDKVAFVLTQMQAGRERNEVAAELGYKDWKGLDVFMRRKGYRYQEDEYVLPSESKGVNVANLVTQPMRIVLQQIEDGNRDLTDIAAKAGFLNQSDLTQYMKTHGWKWDARQETYVPMQDEEASANDNGGADVEEDGEENMAKVPGELDMPEAMATYLPLLRYLLEHRSDLEQLLGQGSKSGAIPRYTIPKSITVTKSVSMASSLDQLTRDFSLERGVSQRNVVEAALIQFLIKYGYSKQVDRLLERD